MRGSAAALVVILAGADVMAQTPAGPYFRVNASTTVFQVDPVVAIDGAGNFVVVWWTQDPDTPILGRRFDRAGSPRGSEFLVAAGTGLSLGPPALAADAAGGFVVTWSAFMGPNDTDVFARRYDASGAPAGAEFRVNTFTTAYQRPYSIASEPSGAFVVVWMGSGAQDGSGAGVFGQRFDPAGNRLGAEFPINSVITGNQHAPSVAMDAAGNFVVVWSSAQQGGLVPAVIAGQRFTREGVRVGSEFQVNGSQGLVYPPSLAVAPSGDFLVTWTERRELSTSLSARRYDVAGTPGGPEFFMHRFGFNGNLRAAATADGAGRMTVAWFDASQSEPLSSDISARRFEASGAPSGRDFRATTRRARYQVAPALKADAAGNLVVAWMDSPSDVSRVDVYAQRARALTPRGLNVDPVADGNSDGNGVLEPGETVEVRTAWHNHTGAALGLAGALSGITGPAGATYSIADGAGGYGVVGDGAVQPCLDCYAAGVTAPTQRPALHWDAVATEALNNGGDGNNEWLLHVGASFPDVPRTSLYYRFVETLLHLRITAGCGSGAYCPAVATERQQMAVFLLVAKEGDGYVPPACGATKRFLDVPPSSPFCRWIEELARRGVVGGCGVDIYCPMDAVSREQMAAFVLKALEPTATPPACTTPIFSDVPADSPFCRWIEELARRGVVSGCASGRFCPAGPVTREQMAVFLTGAFGLTLYGP